MMAISAHVATAPVWRRALAHACNPGLLLAALAFILYLPPAIRVVQLNPDVVEYVDIGRRLVAGEGYRLGVKAYHFGGTEVLHDGLAERPPLYPLMVAALFKAGLGLLGVQVANAVLASACVALVFALGARLFGRRAGLLAGLLAVASPVMVARMVPPMTEAVALSLSLLAAWLVVRFADPPRWQAFAVAGMALGLGYLTRPTAAGLALALLLGVAAAGRNRRRLVAPIVFPITIYSLATRGSLSYSGQTYLYAVQKDADVLRNGYGRPLPTPAEFVTANPDFVAAAVLDNISDYAKLVFLDGDWLLLLLPVWPFAIAALVRGRYPRAACPVLLLAAANFFTYALTWANYQERYQLLTLLLLLPFAVDGLERLGLSRLSLALGRRVDLLHIAVAGIALFWSVTLVREYRGEFRYGEEPTFTRVDRGLRWTGPPRWVQDNDLSRIIDWINARTDRDDVLAHGQPWPFTFFTERPATLLPIKLTPERLRGFLVDYRVAYVLLDTRDRDRRVYQDDLEAFQIELGDFGRRDHQLRKAQEGPLDCVAVDRGPSPKRTQQAGRANLVHHLGRVDLVQRGNPQRDVFVHLD